MTLAERIKLMDDMIRENPDVTIKDYMDLCKELVEIKATNVPEPLIILKQVEQELMEPEKKKRRPWGSRMDKKYLTTYKIR